MFEFQFVRLIGFIDSKRLVEGFESQLNTASHKGCSKVDHTAPVYDA